MKEYEGPDPAEAVLVSDKGKTGRPGHDHAGHDVVGASVRCRKQGQVLQAEQRAGEGPRRKSAEVRPCAPATFRRSCPQHTGPDRTENPTEPRA